MHDLRQVSERLEGSDEQEGRPGVFSRVTFSAGGSFSRAMPLAGGSPGALTVEELAMACCGRVGQLASLVIGERLSVR